MMNEPFSPISEQSDEASLNGTFETPTSPDAPEIQAFSKNKRTPGRRNRKPVEQKHHPF